MLRKALMILATTSVLALASPSQADTQTVVAAGVSFVPAVVVAGGSDTIKITTLDPLQHTFTTDATICAGSTAGSKVRCNTGEFGGINVSRAVTLSATAGTYDFYCNVHRFAGMVGKLVVR